MRSQRTGKYDGWMPMMAAAAVAVVGAAILLLIDFGPANVPQANGGGMITAAEVYRAGAIAIPTQPALRPQQASR